MDRLSVVTFALIVLSFQCAAINADCPLQLGSPLPKTLVHFGSKHLLRETRRDLSAETYETVDLYCSHGFSIHSNYNGLRTVEERRLQLKCNSNGYFDIYNIDIDIQNGNLNQISCAGQQSVQMYESLRKLPDCEDEMTLVVGDDFKELGSLKSMAICFDLVHAKVKYIAYTAYPSKMKMIEKTQIGVLNGLGLDVGVAATSRMFNTISTSDVLKALHKDKQLKQLFGDETYEYANLIQDSAFTDDFQPDASAVVKMLSVVWLRALRTGNWRHLLNALQVASLNAKFDVRVGISGVVKLPTLQHCNETQHMILELDNEDTLAVPSHIWALIQPLEQHEELSNVTADFVVIAHNSPFVSSEQKQELCNSMCHEVDWLNDSLFLKLQRYPIYGSVQCCRVADVAHKLDNFP
ncbi:hypothetical protein KR093_010829, partial [Drosophila rubida]